MVTVVNERQGLVKVFWKDVSEKVRLVEPQFAQIVDELNPDQNFPLYLAYYPYGATDADTTSTLFPDQKGGYYRLTDPEAPRDIVEDFRYSIGYTPLGMVLEKQFEAFIDLKHRGICFPWIIFSPGKIGPFKRILSKEKNIYSPNGLLSSTAGARSVFMLPSIGCATNHDNLLRDFNVQSPAPKYLYDHWSVFKEIINSEVIQSDWRACFLYFTENWIHHLHHDKAWAMLKYYLHTLAWNEFKYETNRPYYDIIFSILQQEKNLKPNPYLVDTAKHLFSLMLGFVPGFTPAVNNEALPYEIIQKVYTESYGLKKYLPTLLMPTYFHFENHKQPIYYSLQPSTHIFSPKSREVSSTLFEMRELERIMRIFMSELIKETSMSYDTIITKLVQSIQIKYFHSKPDNHHLIRMSSEVESYDARFRQEAHKYKHAQAVFANDAPFLRGCISISKHSD